MWSGIQRTLAATAAALIVLMFAASAQAQLRWVKLAPFPEPEEELYGVAVNGKMYVLGGFGGTGVPVGMVYEYDPAGDKWTKKKTMPVPVHHQAMTVYQGKVYIFGGYNRPPNAEPVGWYPVDNAWEYDPAADSWKALAPMPGKRGSAVAAEVGGKIYVIGGAIPQPNTKETGVFPNRPARATGTNEMYDPATNKWTVRSPMPTARNHAFVGTVGGKIYVLGGRIGHTFITVATNTDVVEEYDPATDSWGAIKAKMPTARSGGGYAAYGGRIYTAGGEVQTPQLLGAFRAVEAYDPASNTWNILPAMPLPRHGVAAAFIGNRLHLVSGHITSGGAPDSQVATASHDVLEIPEKY